MVSEHRKEAVLVLGITGSGKSTLVQFLAGNTNDLSSQKVGNDTGEFIIVDKANKISNLETINSKTEYPELFVDTKTNTSYFDCPGFSDTRDVAHDIATSYFIRRAISSSESVKFLFAVDYSAVRVGVDRQHFVSLLKHISDFIKNLDKYENSIALVVTKVENSVMKRGRHLVYVSDENILNNIGSFLNGIKKEFTNNPDFSRDKVFREKAIKLLDIFLSKSSNQYTKLFIFRRPDDSGKIISMELFQTRKADMVRTLTENLKFVTQKKDDFSYTVSDKTKVSINELATSSKVDVTSTISDLFNKLENEDRLNEVEEMYAFKTSLSILSKLLQDLEAHKKVAKRSVVPSNNDTNGVEVPNKAPSSTYCSPTRSNGNSISQSSLINYLSSWVHSSFLSFNVVNTVKDYLFNSNTNHFIKQTEFANSDSSASLETQSFSSFSELLFIADFAIRSCVTGKKYVGVSGGRKIDISNSDFAQNLAYRYYVDDRKLSLQNSNISKVSKVSEHFSLANRRSDFLENGPMLFCVPDKNTLKLNVIFETPLIS